MTTLAMGALVALVASLGLTASPASANAHGITFFGPKVCTPTKPSVCSAAGALHVQTYSVGGSGRDINKVSGHFVYNGFINDFWIDNDIFDANGKRLTHCQGTYHAGYETIYTMSCNFNNFPNKQFIAPTGSHHCATLWRGGSSGPKQAARACNLIH
jgi:hypothetical protein